LNEANHGSKSNSKQEKNKKHQDKSENVDLKALIKLLWNLDRLDQRERVLDGRYVPLASGENVDVYILDTGVRYTHEDFNGRVKYPGYDAIDELTKSNKRGADCNGHGTHCAGTIGGHKYGVAKGVTMYSGRVLTCLGSGAVKGILDMMEYILKSREKEGKTNRAVFSMSVGVKKIDAFNKGVENAAKKGVVVVVASGNQRSDSCKYSPGSSSSVISVAATDENDASTQFSNIGKCMHIFAPGSSIVSAGYSCDTCDSVKSGTSMACPHVAGYAAIILSQHPKLSPKEVREKMIKDSTKGVVDLTGMQQDSTIVDETPNRFMYVGD
jgi:subtilisin family serine protease